MTQQLKLLYFEWSPPWHLYVLLLTNLLSHGYQPLPLQASHCVLFLVCDVASRSAASLLNVTWRHRLQFRLQNKHAKMAYLLTSCLAFYLAYLLAFYLAFYLAYLLTSYLPFYLAYLLTLYLAYLLAFYLAYLLASYLAFYLANLLALYPAYLLAFYLTFYLAFYLACLLAFYLAYLMAFYLACLLAYLLTLYLAYLLAFCLAVEVQRCALSREGPRLRSSGAHWAGKVPGWGPAVHTELGRSQVEVQRCTMSW